MANGQLSGQPPKCTQGCPTGWSFLASNKVCYKFFNVKKSYVNAAAECAKLSAVLAMPKTQEQNDKVAAQRPGPKTNIWIGLSDTVTEGDFKWADGGSLDGWTNWKTKANLFKGKGCAMMQAKWWDMKCTKPQPYVCQAPLAVLRA